MQKYGLIPSGNKTTDKMRLHEAEIKEAKEEKGNVTGLLTVTQGELDRIKEKAKMKREETNPEDYPNTTKGQEALGEQIMLAIKMKKEKKDKEKLLEKDEILNEDIYLNESIRVWFVF